MTTYKQQTTSNILRDKQILASLVVVVTFCAFTKCSSVQKHIYRRCSLSYRTENTKKKKKKAPHKFFKKLFLSFQRILSFRSWVGNLKVYSSILLGKQAHYGNFVL